jgi:hypothetical protein
MTDIFKVLEPVCYKPKFFIYNELDDVNEVHFISEGHFCVGYEINKEVSLRKKFSGS